MKPTVDEPNREAANSARGIFPIRVRFASFLSATWCGLVLLVFGALWIANSGRNLLSARDVGELVAAVMSYLCFGGFFAFVLGVAFGRFLLRATPPHLMGRGKRRQIAIVAVALCTALSGFCILAGFMFYGLARMDNNQPYGYPGILAVFWATGAVGPLLLRHRKPRAFLDRPFVLFLRRFSTFSDRTVIALILRNAKAGMPVVFLTPTHSRPKDWDPFIVGLAGLKLVHPLRSVPIVLRARDDDWQRAADELIGRAQTILVDTSEGSGALGTEAEMIEKAGRWPNTVCLKHTSLAARRRQDSLDAFSNARCIDYSKSWTRALPRLAISLPIALFAAFVIGGYVSSQMTFPPGLIHLLVEGLVYVAITLIFYSVFWRPAVNRNAKIELKRVLRPENRSENKRPDSITVIAWIMLFFAATSLLTSMFTINGPVPEMIAKNPMSFADKIISIVSAIFILRGANWARLLYICWGAFLLLMMFLTLPAKYTLIPGVLYLVVVFFLLRPKASAYFASYNRVKAS